jgi:hypothetical protein
MNSPSYKTGLDYGMTTSRIASLCYFDGPKIAALDNLALKMNCSRASLIRYAVDQLLAVKGELPTDPLPRQPLTTPVLLRR